MAVFFHVGLMKSGTTFLQGRLNANRRLLAEQGVLFPGPSWARHTHAVSDLIGGKQGNPGDWKRLVAELDAHEASGRGAAIVSMEYLASVGKPRIKQLRRDLGSEPQIIVTVRDLGRSVPAMWQESVKNRQYWTYDQYVEMARDVAKDQGKFWKQQDAGAIVSRYASVVGGENVHVITVPPPGAPSTLLWHRFCEVTGITPADWAEAPRANESLGAASTQLMLRLNHATTDLAAPAYKKRVKGLAKHVLGDLRKREDAIGFAVPDWLRAEADRCAEEIRASGARVVGDLTELAPVDVPGVDPAGVGAEDELRAAVDGLAGVLRQVRRVKPRKA